MPDHTPFLHLDKWATWTAVSAIVQLEIQQYLIEITKGRFAHESWEVPGSEEVDTKGRKAAR